ncbi:PAS-domain containing protein [Rhizobium sp. SSA_523]|uniref:hybrid sensor histidine kinase/response regulator n=1 Tax=Rhizobium sp. SSA_523 TaxID=2952477 RepID=UPI00209006D7|nr:PAS-domain containing protein [Rhizobium sp. SSA_523]MCO5732407.1 PAS-domain containing protein [Rhizobium sp. SSA_523]WKC22448.1 PAS-domain containing protein [Rhizobium sp. SSA_523]
MPISGEEHNGLMKTGLNLISQALSIFDSSLNLAVCNRRYQDMFDLPEAYVTAGVSFEETIRLLVRRGEYGPVDDEEEAVRSRVEAARAFVPHYMERLRSNGRWVSVEGFPLPQGGWVTVYTDITEVRIQQQMLRTRSVELSEQLLSNTERLSETNRALSAANTALEAAKNQLAEMEARTRLTTEMMPAHIAHVDRNLRYTYTNRRLSAVIPGRPSQIIGLTGYEALGESSFAKIRPHLARALAGEASVCEFTDADSGRRIRTAFTPDRIGEGPINGVYILSTDITEESQARAAVLQTRKRELAAQLTSGLAHDFANLLTIILGLQTRLEQLDLPEGAAELVTSTLAAARRGGTLTDRIASISGQKQLRPEPVHMPTFLHDLCRLAGPALPDHISLRLQSEPIETPLVLDAGALQDSLLNLILNAKDAIGAVPGTISLHARSIHETWLELAVCDTGCGFSDKALSHAFDPFFTTKGGEGSGLGLSMVYDQATISGGTVRLENLAGGGARVELRLPYRPAPANAPSRLVLLVEDSVEIRETVRDMLLRLGHAVVEAASAAEAEALADVPELDILLTDLHLKGSINGLDLAQKLQKRRALAVGVMTSLPSSAPLRQAADARFPLLAKPFEDRALASFITRVAG